MSTGSARRATAFRAAAAAVALVAALGPEGGPREGPVLRVLLADVSWSTGRDAPSAADLAALTDGLAAGDRAAVVVFAAGARVAAAPSAAGELRVAHEVPDRFATSLAAALRAAAGLRAPGDRLELLLSSDGRCTEDPPALRRAAEAVVAGGGAVLRTRGPADAPRRSAVIRLTGPGRASSGEPVALEAAGIAGPAGATVELTGGGEVVESRRIEGAGPFRVAFTRLADAPGLAVWECRTRESPEVPPAAARVVVASPGSVALVQSVSPRAAVAQALPSAVPVAAGVSLAERLAGHDAAVADGVLEDAEAAEALRNFASGGGGVVLVGSFEAAAAGMEALSPLRTRPPDGAPPVVYLAIDGSGSMAEPWTGDAGGPARDLAVRAAADALLRRLPDGTRVLLRRFREVLVPPGEGPAEIDLRGDAGRERALGAVRALAAPGGSTSFAPVLDEAFEMVGARPEEQRVAVFLTDGRSSEDADLLASAFRRLAASGVRPVVVVPGAVPGRDADAPLVVAAEAAGVPVRAAAEPADLAAVLAAAERSAREGERRLRDRALALSGTARSVVAEQDVPATAFVVARTWAAPDATVFVQTEDGHPFAAIRRAGQGAVAAAAAPLPDAAWVGDDGGAALLRALVRAVARRASARARVTVRGSRLLARVETADGGAPPAAVRIGAREHLFRPEPGGVLSADLGSAPADAPLAALLDADGGVVATVGLDRAAPAEVGDVPVTDLAALAAALRPLAPGPGRPLRPWLAALAAALLVAGSVKSPGRRTR